MSSERIGLAAAKEHLIRRKTVSAHVIVCHNLDVRTRDVIGMWSAANRASPLLLQDLTREILDGILTDCKGLQDELRGIERWARSQLDKLPDIMAEGRIDP